VGQVWTLLMLAVKIGKVRHLRLQCEIDHLF
jgi:hypothetical protein